MGQVFQQQSHRIVIQFHYLVRLKTMRVFLSALVGSTENT